MNSELDESVRMVCLIGEAHLANLIPLRCLQASSALLVHTDRTLTHAERLKALLQDECRCELLEVDAYELPAVRADLAQHVKPVDGYNGLCINLTGGTKPMILAGFGVAIQLDVPFCYMETHGPSSTIVVYRVTQGLPKIVNSFDADCTITVDEFLRLHLGSYTQKPPHAHEGARYEALIADCVRPSVDELLASACKGNLEIDLILRRGSRFAVVETSTGSSNHKKKIDQLAAAGQSFGPHTHKLYVYSGELDENNLGLASAHRITPIRVRLDAAGGVEAEDLPALVAALEGM